MKTAFVDVIGDNGGDGGANGLIHYLTPNIRYGDRFEVNVYAAPHKYAWLSADEELHTWSAWAALVLKGSALPENTESPTAPRSLDQGCLPLITASLNELQTDAAEQITTWLRADAARGSKILTNMRDMEPAAAINLLHRDVSFTGVSAEFVESATVLLHQIDPHVPVYYQGAISRLLSEFSSLFSDPQDSPGELFMALQEAIASLRCGLFYRAGFALGTTTLAALAQEIMGLDPAETDWDNALKPAFQDWRAGLRHVSPDEVGLEVDNLDQPVPANLQEEPVSSATKSTSVPATFDELATRLTFETDESKEWLRKTQGLLRQNPN